MTKKTLQLSQHTLKQLENMNTIVGGENTQDSICSGTPTLGSYCDISRLDNTCPIIGPTLDSICTPRLDSICTPRLDSICSIKF